MNKELLQERKKMIYDFICDELYVPMKAKEMAIVLNVPKSQRGELLEVLDALTADGKVEISGRGKYVKSEGKYLTGVFTAHPRGFGFVTVEGEEEDIFIPAAQTNGALHKDTVQITLSKNSSGKRKEGTVTKILSRGTEQLVCTYEKSKTFGFAVPDNPRFAQDIFIPLERSKGAVSGHKVVVEITDYGKNGKKPEGKVVEIIGHINDPGTDIMSIVKGYDLPVEFSQKIMKQVENVSNEVSAADMAGRMDLRDWQTVTIDGEDAKDLDDAITLTKEGDNYKLGVHIADVSNYVKPGSELDNEAFNRATSVYYADQVVPMLPKQLSNGICSLNEGVLRLAFSCLMRLDKDGNLTDYRFVKSVIRSRVKGVYSEINALLAGNADDELTGKYHEVLAQLPAMKELYGHRARLRKERGCMDIESGEVKLILDEDGHCIDVKKRTSGESEAMIEEFMLLANQCAAHFARVKQIPFVYRVHEEPNAEKLERLHGLLQACGVNDHFAKEVPTPKELSAILEGVRGGPYEQIINTGMLRCMSKAVYEEKPKGHYGLVLQDYAHFTSPIRRYPDLAIHRIMTAQLKGTDKDTMILRYSEFAEDVSKQASEREVIAMQIERKAEDCYKAEYARRHLGECYEGRISGVTQRGLFIELENGVEGFVPASSLTATGTMLTEGVRLSDPVSGKNWNLGDTMMITIVRADVNLGKIDFEVAPESAKQ